MNIERCGIVYIIKKHKGEVNNMYFDRALYIVKNVPSKFNETEYLKIKDNAELLCVKKHLECQY